MHALRISAPSSLTLFLRSWGVAWVLLLGLLMPGLLLAQDGLAPIPALSARVIDTTGTLDAGQRQALEAKLADFEQKRGTQIVVLMVPTTQPEDIVGYTQRVGDLWKIGRKDVGDGLLVVVAKNDRTVRIATAKTLEGAVPDLAARLVISETITPRFREGDFAGGLSAGLDRIMGLVTGEQLPVPSTTGGASGAGGESGLQWLDLLVLVFFVVPLGVRVLGGIFGRKSGALLTAGGIGVVSWLLTASVVVAVLAGMAGLVFALASGLAGYGPGLGLGGGNLSARRGRGGWTSGSGGWGHGGHGGWGGSGGGGFSSGGGGDFGGGGASGKW
jgi:uncharacterized protein